MSSTIFDSAIFRDVFGTDAMRRVFSDEATLAAYVRVEVALAVAQARLGLIPAEHAAAIAKGAGAVALDHAKLKAEAENVGYPIAGLVRQLSAKLGEPGRSLHWGATTQDVMDTAVVLQVRDALAIVDSELAAISAALAKLSATHRDTPMAGRTHLQQALPITFGHKTAIWLSAIERHRDRLHDLEPRVFRAQLGGAAGTLASMGPKALDVHREFATELMLAPADIPWHVARDGLCEVVGELSFDKATTISDFAAMERFCASCFETHRVHLVRVCLARNRMRAILIFRAPDAESVRLACRPMQPRSSPSG